MRTRMILESDFKDEDLGSLSPEHWKVYQGLKALADREGRMEDRPKRIWSEICPYHPTIDIEKILDDLAQIKDLLGVPRFIERYEANGHKYIQILGFTAEQPIHPREAQSIIPAKDEPRTSLGQAKDCPRRPVSTSTSTSTSTLKKEIIKKESFDRFWAAYPTGYKVGKIKALAAWKKLNPSDELVAKMLAAIQKQTKSEKWQRGIIPNPATWLNQGRWDDELKPAGAGDRAIKSRDRRDVF